MLSTRANFVSAFGLALATATASFVLGAKGDSTPSPTVSAPSASSSTGSSVYTIPWSGDPGDTRAGLDPFPSTGQYISYGASFYSEAKFGSGSLCPKDATTRCVLGSGGGIAFSGAYRGPGYSIGAVYEVTFHDSNAVYQRGVLQQARGEWRYRPRFGVLYESVNLFGGLGAGIATYGDDWGISTFGPSGHLTVGSEIDLGVKLSLVFSFAYRVVYFRQFVDASKQDRPAGPVQMLGIQLGLELHDPL